MELLIVTHRILMPSKTQLVEQVSVKEESKLDDTLWHSEKYWQGLWFTNSHGMNNMADLYSEKRKGYKRRDVHDLCCLNLI